MKKLLFILFSFVLICCSGLIDKPKNLIDKSKMSEIIAEFAMDEQVVLTTPGNDMETATRYILKQKNIKANDFLESYKYYTSTGDLDKILSNAQEIVLKKDEKSQEFINKKLKENKNLPSFAR